MTIAIKNVKLSNYHTIYEPIVQRLFPSEKPMRYPFYLRFFAKDNPEHEKLCITHVRSADDMGATFKSTHAPLINVDDWRVLDEYRRICAVRNMSLNRIFDFATVDLHVTAVEMPERGRPGYYEPADTYLAIREITVQVANLRNPEHYENP